MPDFRRLFPVLLILAGAGWYLSGSLRPSPTAAKSNAAAAPAVDSKERSSHVGALGRFLPENGVLRVAAPYYESRPSVVSHLAVQEGQSIQQGQLIAVLDGKPQVEAERARALAQIELARRRLELVRAGTKKSDHEAQRAEIRRLEAAHRLEEIQLARHEKLFASRDVAASTLDESRAAEQTSRRAIEAARERLSSVIDVREEDVRVAESELAVAQAQLQEIATRLAALTVNAPASGVVVKIYARSGEQAAALGILEMADVSRMDVEAEVYASDLGAVAAGQRVTIEPEDGSAKMTGEVIRLGAEVRPATVLSGDPASFNDARVVPVRIRVPGCAESRCPINGRVRITIDTRRERVSPLQSKQQALPGSPK